MTLNNRSEKTADCAAHSFNQADKQTPYAGIPFDRGAGGAFVFLFKFSRGAGKPF